MLMGRSDPKVRVEHRCIMLIYRMRVWNLLSRMDVCIYLVFCICACGDAHTFIIQSKRIPLLFNDVITLSTMDPSLNPMRAEAKLCARAAITKCLCCVFSKKHNTPSQMYRERLKKCLRRQRAVCAKSLGRHDVRDSALMPFSPKLILIYGEDWVASLTLYTVRVYTPFF